MRSFLLVMLLATATRAEEPKPRASAEKACGGGDVEVCEAHIVELVLGLGRARDEARAERLFRTLERRCGDRCAELGDVAWRVSDLYDPDVVDDPEQPTPGFAQRRTNKRTTFRWRERACAHGHRLSCVWNASSLYDGDGVRQDVAEAVRRFHRDCLAGDQGQCRRLDRAHRSGHFELPDLTHAEHERYCELGFAISCHWLSRQMPATPEGRKRANDYRTRGWILEGWGPDGPHCNYPDPLD